MLRLVVLALLGSLLGQCNVGEPGFPGPYVAQSYAAVLEANEEISVFYPKDPLGSSFSALPLVIFSAAWNQPRASYEGYARQLAEWGYVVVLRSYPSLGILGVGDPLYEQHLAQTLRIIDWCAQENQQPSSALYGMVDADNVGAAGHSMGAIVSLGAAVSDPRVRAAVSLDVTYTDPTFGSAEPLQQVDAAILYVRAGAGGWCSNTSGSTTGLFEVTKTPAAEVTIVGAGHMDFIEKPIGAAVIGEAVCPNGDADPQKVRTIALRYLISWFNVYLKGQSESATYFAGSEAEADEAAGLVEIRLNLVP